MGSIIWRIFFMVGAVLWAFDLISYLRTGSVSTEIVVLAMVYALITFVKNAIFYGKDSAK